MNPADDALAEHRAALAKIDEAVSRASTKAADALVCARGCSSCCVDGLTVLPVEAAFIEASGLAAPTHASTNPGACAFLDVGGACAVYAARPVLCRTHGLALRARHAEGHIEPGRALKIIDDVSACSLNYTARAPKPDEILDVEKILALLVTVDRRFRARAGLPDDTSRVALRDIATRSS